MYMHPKFVLLLQADPLVGVPSPASMHSTPLFGGISNTTFPIGTSNAFHGDAYGTPGFLDRPKKVLIEMAISIRFYTNGLIWLHSPSRQKHTILKCNYCNLLLVE